MKITEARWTRNDVLYFSIWQQRTFYFYAEPDGKPMNSIFEVGCSWSINILPSFSFFRRRTVGSWFPFAPFLCQIYFNSLSPSVRLCQKMLVSLNALLRACFLLYHFFVRSHWTLRLCLSVLCNTILSPLTQWFPFAPFLFRSFSTLFLWVSVSLLT